MSSQDSHESDLDHKVLIAARRLLAEGNGPGFSMDRLAAESGVSRATIYRRVGGRVALLKRIASEGGLQVGEIDRDHHKCILQATLTILRSSGSLDFTVEQVAAEAGVGVATVYRHFGSKDNLLKQIAAEFHPRRAALDLLAHAGDDLQAELEHFVRSVLGYMQNQGNLARAFMFGETRLRKIFVSFHSDQERTLDSLNRYLEAQMKSGRLPARDPFDLSAALMGMIIGFAFIKPSYTKQAEDPQQAARTIVRQFLDGVRKDTP
jgi:AcrR family transcriptional regulator